MLYNRTVLVTGGTASLGYYCALSIAREHPEYQVVVASRTDKESAASSINRTLNQNNVVFLPLDLSSLAKVRSFVQTWETQSFPPIQLLLLNAGLQIPGGVTKTEDGIESTFAVNHVGHALLFHLLLPYLSTRRESWSRRVAPTTQRKRPGCQIRSIPVQKSWLIQLWKVKRILVGKGTQPVNWSTLCGHTHFSDDLRGSLERK